MKNPFLNCLCITIFALSLSLGRAFAQSEIVEFENDAQRDLYTKTIKELRCLVCQNQNLADSNASLAQDLRRKTYEMIRQGKQYDEIIEYMIDRYGEFVIYRPRLKSSTLFLWLSPFALFVLVMVLAIRRNRKLPDEPPSSYSDEELQRAKSLIDKN